MSIPSVLVTGGSGFLGKKICACIKHYGQEVLAPRSSVVDLMDLESICRYIRRNRKPSAIIHSAAYYGGLGINQEQPADMLYINTIMAANVWEAAARTGIETVVSVGSACAYPGDLQGDFKEEDLEAGPCHPSVEGYGMTKRIHRVLQRQYKKQYGITGSQPILTNLYGPGDDCTEYRSHVVGALVDRFCRAALKKTPVVTCWGDGSPIREFLYVDDAAEGIYQVAKKSLDGAYNIGTGIGTSIKELTELVASAAKYEGEIEWDTSKPNGAARKVLDVTKTRDEIGFETAIPLADGLAEMVGWWQIVHAPRGL